MLTKVTSLEKLGGFRLRVRFSDGSAGVHDFAALVNEPGPMLSRCAMRPISRACFSNSVRRHGRTASTLRVYRDGKFKVFGRK